MVQNWHSDYIEVEGIQLHYTYVGEGDKPVVVLLHGFSDNGLCWTPVARDLEESYDLILPDARGHGLSARVQPGEQVDLAEDLAGMIRGLGLQRVVVGGHSMGAHISAEMAASYPDLVRALILEDPAWFQQTPAQASETGARNHQPPNPIEWLLKVLGKPVEEVMAICHRDNPKWQEAELRPWAESKLQFDLNFLQIERIFHKEWQEVVPAITCPTLLITSEPALGALVTPEIAQMAVYLNPKLQSVHVPGAGHNIRRENYPEFIKIVRNFLDNLERYPTG